MSNKLILIGCAVFLVIGIAIWVGIFAFDEEMRKTRASAQSAITSQAQRNSSPSKDAPSASPKPSVISREDAKGMVSFDYKWGKSGFDMVMEVDFTFTNRSPYPAKDITVTCTHFAPSGTEIDSNTRTIYEIIPANGKKIIKKFNMGFIHTQATSTTCKIDDFEM